MSEVVKTYRCPICKKIAPAGKYKPFCSKRCADIDLGNWFNESYRISVQEMDEEDYEELEKSWKNSIRKNKQQTAAKLILRRDFLF